jgi:DNA-binding SARP family transcriptional activator
VRIALLGPVELSQDGRRIRLNGSKQLALLALLALNADRPISADHIVDALWGTTNQATRSTPCSTRSPGFEQRSAGSR